jgi:voltage-gated potassium channel
MAAGKDTLRKQLRVIIFGTHTRSGRLFDIILIILILISVLLVFLESLTELQAEYGTLLRTAEWAITILFTLEYITRLWITDNWRRYAFGFYGIVDVLAILPTYASILIPGSQALTVVRGLRLTRIFRIFNLLEYAREAQLLLLALLASRHRILVFMLAVLVLVTVFGAIMYVVEPAEAGFTSVPRSIYWAIVTLTTVGYGDIAPITALGQAIASAIMILGYAIIAIPTGIVSVELARRTRNSKTRLCETCGNTEITAKARYCDRCGSRMKDLREEL